MNASSYAIRQSVTLYQNINLANLSIFIHHITNPQSHQDVAICTYNTPLEPV
jgi:hypothetical protein